MAPYFLVAVAQNKHWSCDSHRMDAKTITGGPSRLMVGSRHCRLNASFGLLRIQSIADEKRLKDDSFVLHLALSASAPYTTLCTSARWPCIQAVHQLFCYRLWVAYDVQFCWHRDGNSILHRERRQFAPATVFPAAAFNSSQAVWQMHLQSEVHLLFLFVTLLSSCCF